MAPSQYLTAQFLINSLLLLILIDFCAAADDPRYVNCSRRFSCGGTGIGDIKYPFWGGDRPPECGVSGLMLRCSTDNSTTTINIAGKVFRVIQIDPRNKTMKIASTDPICSPTFPNATFVINQKFDDGGDMKLYYSRDVENLRLLYSCPNSTHPHRFKFSCPSSNATAITENYAVSENDTNSSCNQSITIPVTDVTATGQAVASLEDLVNDGFEVMYGNNSACESCEQSGGLCWSGTFSGPSPPTCLCPGGPKPLSCNLKSKRFQIRASWTGIVVLASICGYFVAFIIWCCWERPWSSAHAKNSILKNFLAQQGSLALKRYTYSTIKKITKSLSDKLGEGGYGSVYKGTLPDGCLVAVKLLAETSSDGEEFINEVTSISKTSHVNIVTLLGFCYERNKRALVYEFMPNKSLDKFIGKGYENPTCDGLDVEKLYKIATGVAKGLEYLHFGCNTRIVHFDIKPQNILLDEDFCPKISDFGLAQLCKKKQSMLSLIGTRGTIGYIAPEVFSGHFGRVSHKSDVYSYGMMVLEIVESRIVVEETDTNQFSENYFPDEIYKKAMLLIDPFRGTQVEEEDDERIKKMYLVGFWCIQSLPSDRPTISKVVEMLEGSLESIQIPPKPYLYHPNLSTHELSTYAETTEESTERSQA